LGFLFAVLEIIHGYPKTRPRSDSSIVDFPGDDVFFLRAHFTHTSWRAAKDQAHRCRSGGSATWHPHYCRKSYGDQLAGEASSSLGLAAKIPDGMRATAVKTNEITNVAGFIFPGSRVDVLVTLKPENNTASTETRIALQNVQVLSTGTKMDPDPNGKPENVNVVTLLVTPEQSEKLALSQAQGTIHFALRNGADSVNSDVAPVDIAELAGIPKKPPQAEMPRPKQPAVAVKPPTPEFYTIETIANGKTTITKFPMKPE
jgi:Flp pilus assembly protein CpaB